VMLRGRTTPARLHYGAPLVLGSSYAGRAMHHLLTKQRPAKLADIEASML
jgi:hypothetical protein